MDTKSDFPITKLLLAIIALLVIIIFLLLGWKIAKLEFLGFELEPPATSTPELVPTPTIAMSEPTNAPPANTPRPANSISREEVRQLNFGQVSIEEVNNCLAQVHAGTRPFVSFREGDTIPATTLIATDFGGGGVTYNQLPVVPICHNGSWGLFESQESFTAPYEGAYWFIVP